MEENKKSYYAIIPAEIRYDKRLKLLSRMLFGEITALCNEKGYCWANNQYFAQLYNVSKRTISDCINQLEKSEYINIKTIYKNNTKEVEKRIIKINLWKKISIPYGRKTTDPIEEIFQDNNTFNNTYNIEEEKSKRKFIPPTLDEIEAYCKKRNNNVNPKQFFDYYNEENWCDSNGKKLKSWKQKMIAVWEKKFINTPPKSSKENIIYETITDDDFQKNCDEFMKVCYGFED